MSESKEEIDTNSPLNPSTTSPLLQAVEPEGDVGGLDTSTEDLPPSAVGSVDWPAEDHAGASLASPHYATHLWHCVGQVIDQAEEGRRASKAFVQLVREKADLDRDYAAKLRTIAEKYSDSLSLPQRPKATNTFQAGCCAIRNLCVNLAANSELLAEKLDEDTADAFLSNAQELSELVKPLVAQTKLTSKKLTSALSQLEQAKAILIKACSEHDSMKNGGSGSGTPPHRKASASTEVDFLTDFVASSFRSHTPEAVLKRVQTADQQYIAAIKKVREVRQEYDGLIKSHLAEFESLESKRLNESLEAVQSFSKLHQLAYTSHLKNITAVNTTLQNNIRVLNDLNSFITESLKSTGRTGAGAWKPSPLPVYKLFRGHPRFTGGGASASRGVDEPLTDSDAGSNDEQEEDEEEDQPEEITLSGEEDNSDNAVNGLESQTDSDAEDGEEEEQKSRSGGVGSSQSLQSALAAKSRSAGGLSPSQQTALNNTIARIVSLPVFSTSEPASPVSLEPDRSTVVETLNTPEGRVAFAAAVRNLVKDCAPTTTAAAPSSSKLDPSTPATPAAQPDGSIPPVSPHPVAAGEDEIGGLDLSRAGFDALLALSTELLDHAEPSMHVAPVLGLLKVAKRIRCTEGNSSVDDIPVSPTKNSSSSTPKSKGKPKKGSPDANIDASEDVALNSSASSTSTASTLYSSLLSHPIFTQSRWYDAAYLSELARLYSKHALVHRWQSDKEQKQKLHQQKQLAFGLLKSHGIEMSQLGRIDDQQIVNFVGKHSSTNQLDPLSQAELISSIPAFTRLGVSEMPTLAGTAATLNVDSSPKERSGSGAQLPVALPVATPIAPMKK